MERDAGGSVKAEGRVERANERDRSEKRRGNNKKKSKKRREESEEEKRCAKADEEQKKKKKRMKKRGPALPQAQSKEEQAEKGTHSVPIDSFRHLLQRGWAAVLFAYLAVSHEQPAPCCALTCC